MARGGKRQGAGRREGSKNKATVRKARLRELLDRRVERQFGPVIDALLEAALGVNHMMARERDGRWVQVTDPKMMQKVLNSGETFYKIHAQNPDVRALKEILEQVIGRATEQVEHTGGGGGPIVLTWQS